MEKSYSGCDKEEVRLWTERAYALASKVLASRFGGTPEIVKSRKVIEIGGMEVGVRNEIASVAQVKRSHWIWMFPLLSMRKDWFILMPYRSYSSEYPEKIWLVAYNAFHKKGVDPNLYGARYIIIMQQEFASSPLAKYEVPIPRV